MTPALQVYAGPRARALLSERGLVAGDVRAIPAAAGGPKGLVHAQMPQGLNSLALDRQATSPSQRR